MAQHAQPSTHAILSLHPTEEGAATTKSYSAMHNHATSVPARSPAGRPAAIAGSSLKAAHGAHVSMASQFAQQARPPVQPDLSTADNYGAGPARPQMSDSVVQPQGSLVQPTTRGGRGAGSVVGGSRAASRGVSGGRGGGGGPTESVCSKRPRGTARTALSEQVGEAPGRGGRPRRVTRAAVADDVSIGALLCTVWIVCASHHC